MINSDQIILDCTMVHSKQKVLEQIKQNNIYFPTNMESKLLKWNCIPLINLDTNKLKVSFGVFFFQIIILSQEQIVRDRYEEYLKYSQQFKSINPDIYIKLCKEVFTEESFKPFPQNVEFKRLEQQFLECFVYEQHFFGEQPSCFQSRKYIILKQQKEEDLKYRILLYQSPNEYGSKVHLIFSTNNDVEIIKNQNDPKLTSSIQIQPNQSQCIKKIQNIHTIQKFLSQSNKKIYASQIFFPQVIQQNQIPSQYKTLYPSYIRIPNTSNPQNQSNINCMKFDHSKIVKPQQSINGILTQTSQFDKSNFQQKQNFDDHIHIFSTQEINSKQQDQNKQFQSNIQVRQSSKLKVESQQCAICWTQYDLNSEHSIITPCCNQKVHTECVQKDLQAKAKETMDFEKINCFQCNNSLKNYQDFLKQNISIQLVGEIIKRQVLTIPLKCFNCQSPILSRLGDTQINIQCLNCNAQLCSLCCQSYHGQNEKNQQCPSLFREIRKVLEGMPVLICPFCNLIQTKDDKCNRVKCFACQSYLCSACSVDIVPIDAHGNHYHRDGCADYKPWIKNGKVIKKTELNIKECQRCKESNQACQYPISLQEYKKLKQF